MLGIQLHGAPVGLGGGAELADFFQQLAGLERVLRILRCEALGLQPRLGRLSGLSLSAQHLAEQSVGGVEARMDLQGLGDVHLRLLDAADLQFGGSQVEPQAGVALRAIGGQRV